MGKPVASRKADVDAVLDECGVDLESQVFFSNDDVIANEVMPGLDRTDERDVPGLTRQLFPVVTVGASQARFSGCLKPGATVPWHCHPDIDVYHTVCTGQVTVERLKKDENGNPITGADGQLEREESELSSDRKSVV